MSRRRTLVLALLVLIALLAGYVVFEAWRLCRTEPIIAVDYRAAMHARAVAMSGVDPDAGTDAWKAMTRAFDLFEQATADTIDRAKAEDEPSRGAWDVGLVDYSIILADTSITPAAAREIGALRLFEERGGADTLARFARAAAAFEPLPAPADGAAAPAALDQIVFPELARARELARGLAARMRVAQVEQDPDTAAASFEQLLALARTMSYQPGLIGHLVGRAIHALAIDELDRELAEHDVGEALARRLLDALDRSKLAPVELAVEAERGLFHDMVQRHFTDDGHGDGRLAEDNLASAAVARFIGPSRARVTRIGDEYFDRYIETARLPAAERATKGFDRAAFISGLSFSPSTKFVRRLLPDLDAAIKQTDRSRSQTAGARLMLAIAIHRARHGAPPERLEDLAPAILPTVPSDPLHGGPFGYRRDDTSADGFVLYSFGADGTDDGGTSMPGRPSDAYGPGGDGFDAVLNLPRPAWPHGQ